MFDLNNLKGKWFYFSRKKKGDVFAEPIGKLQLKKNHSIGNSPNFNESYWDIVNGKLHFYNGHKALTSVFESFTVQNDKIHVSGRYAPDKNVLHELTQTTPASAKINIYKYQELSTHRSGWPYAVNCLWDIHNPSGTRFDDFIDASFSWGWTRAFREFIPYRDPWIGVMHNPPSVVFPFDKGQDPNNWFEKLEWKASVEHCKGIYVLSQHLADWLVQKVDVPVEVLIHPTGAPEEYFEWDRFMDNKDRGVVQVGWWLRKLATIFQLPVTKLRKTMLHLGGQYVSEALNKEARQYKKKNNGKELDTSGTDILYYIKDLDYDELLSKNVVFLNLYDASANNAVVECIVRNTPMLVNRIPAVVEYIGEDYPLYFDDLDEAAKKVEDMSRVKAAYEYLRDKDKDVFRGKYFVESIKRSSIYKSL